MGAKHIHSDKIDYCFSERIDSDMYTCVKQFKQRILMLEFSLFFALMFCMCLFLF